MARAPRPSKNGERGSRHEHHRDPRGATSFLDFTDALYELLTDQEKRHYVLSLRDVSQRKRAQTEIEEAKKAAAGMNDHISKPIDSEAMFQTMNKYLHTAAAARQEEQVTGAIDHEEVPALSIEGVDVASGLRRVAGNRRLYMDLLRRFADGERAAPVLIGEALARGDGKTAERLAHTAKGSAGNLGIGGAQAAAGDLEASHPQWGEPPRSRGKPASFQRLP